MQNSAPQRKRPPAENKPSALLSKEENDLIFRLIGNKCQTMATTVVQLYLSTQPNHMHWQKHVTGIACFVRDNSKRSYFIRVYCPYRQTEIWEQEIYNQLQYTAVRPFFHTFEGENCMVGLNFADEREAETFQNVVVVKVQQKAQKKTEKRKQQAYAPPVIKMSNGAIPPPSSNHMFQTYNKSKTVKKDRKKLTKADISSPTDFKHVSHVGFDPNRGFDLNNVEPQLKEFFVKVGISESQLQDQDTRDFIYDFIDKNGGMEAVKKSVVLPTILIPPPVPARVQHPPTVQPMKSTPPAPPSRSMAPPPPSRTPPMHHAPPPHPPPPSAVPSNLRGGGAPPPPPPPPPPPAEGIMPPPPPPMANIPSSTPVAVDGRSELFEAIRGGTTLRHVEVDQVQRSGRDDLLDQIRAGVKLHAVPDNPKPHHPKEEGLAGALARALAERSRAIHSDSDESNDEEDDDDDEWDE